MLQDAIAKQGEKSVKENVKSNYIGFSIYFSKLLLAKQRYKEAEKMIAPAYLKQEGLNADLSSLYVKALAGLKKDTEVYQFLRPLFISGEANTQKREQSKTLSEKLKISQKLYAADVKVAHINAIKVLEEKLKMLMVNIPAANFTLQDLSGKMVSLADYKGKIVILGFWAILCVPCNSSFPAMQQAINAFKVLISIKVVLPQFWWFL